MRTGGGLLPQRDGLALVGLLQLLGQRAARARAARVRTRAAWRRRWSGTALRSRHRSGISRAPRRAAAAALRRVRARGAGACRDAAAAAHLKMPRRLDVYVIWRSTPADRPVYSLRKPSLATMSLAMVKGEPPPASCRRTCARREEQGQPPQCEEAVRGSPGRRAQPCEAAAAGAAACGAAAGSPPRRRQARGASASRLPAGRPEPRAAACLDDVQRLDDARRADAAQAAVHERLQRLPRLVVRHFEGASASAGAKTQNNENARRRRCSASRLASRQAARGCLPLTHRGG